MADQKMDLPGQMPNARNAITRQQSRASVTAQDYIGTGSMMKNSFVDLQKSDQFNKDTEAQIDKYDTNKDGMFDRAEVKRIVMDVKEKAHEAEQLAKGAKRIAENLNDTNVRDRKKKDVMGGGGMRGGVVRRDAEKENGRVDTSWGWWWCGTLLSGMG